ncbi:MAG: tRNA adenosine(34) deaminase TadA [Elusimicrobiota bacterium]
MSDNFFIKEALKEAKKALKKGEVPVGCIIVKDNKIISRAHNLTIKKNDPTAHAEILAIKKAAQKIGNYRLTNCDLYVTIEPCLMCAGGAIWARIKRIIFGVYDDKSGACGSVVNIANNKKINYHIEIKSGVLSSKCANLMKNFFKKKR